MKYWWFPKTGPESEELMGRQFIFVNARRFLPVGFNQFPNRLGAWKVVLCFINWSIVFSTEAGGFLLAIAAGACRKSAT